MTQKDDSYEETIDEVVEFVEKESEEVKKIDFSGLDESLGDPEEEKGSKKITAYKVLGRGASTPFISHMQMFAPTPFEVKQSDDDF